MTCKAMNVIISDEKEGCIRIFTFEGNLIGEVKKEVKDEAH